MRSSSFEEDVVEIVKMASLPVLYEIYYCISTGEFAEMSGCSEDNENIVFQIAKQEIQKKRGNTKE